MGTEAILKGGPKDGERLSVQFIGKRLAWPAGEVEGGTYTINARDYVEGGELVYEWSPAQGT